MGKFERPDGRSRLEDTDTELVAGWRAEDRGRYPRQQEATEGGMTRAEDLLPVQANLRRISKLLL